MNFRKTAPLTPSNRTTGCVADLFRWCHIAAVYVNLSRAVRVPENSGANDVIPCGMWGPAPMIPFPQDKTCKCVSSDQYPPRGANCQKTTRKVFVSGGASSYPVDAASLLAIYSSSLVGRSTFRYANKFVRYPLERAAVWKHAIGDN